MDLKWQITDADASAYIPVGNSFVLFKAENFRVERSHQHATCSILYNTLLLEQDDIALHKMEERKKLMNAAHKTLMIAEPALDTGRNKYLSATAHRQFLDFIKQAWGKWHDNQSITDTVGSDREEIPWLLSPFCTINAGTIIFAPPASGKSWLGLTLAVATDAGSSSLWTPREQGNTLYINLERSPESFERRLGSVNSALLGEDSRKRPLKMLHGRGKSLTDVGETIQRAVKKYNIKLIILDSLSRAGSSLIDDSAANRTMDALNKFGCAWIAIGHTPRDDSKHVFGSQMFSAAADQEWAVTHRQIENDNRMWQKLHMIKGNDVPNMADVHIEYTMNKYGIEKIRHISKDSFPNEIEG
jgi:RecA-family ATPase